MLIEKHYHGKVKRNICDLFWEEVTKAPSRDEVIGLDWIGLDWIGLDWIGLDWIDCCYGYQMTNSIINQKVPPVIVTPKYYLINIHRFGLFFLSTLQNEYSPLLVVETHHRIVDLMLQYFDGKVTETALREHFSTVYQVGCLHCGVWTSTCFMTITITNRLDLGWNRWWWIPFHHRTQSAQSHGGSSHSHSSIGRCYFGQLLCQFQDAR